MEPTASIETVLVSTSTVDDVALAEGALASPGGKLTGSSELDSRDLPSRKLNGCLRCFNGRRSLLRRGLDAVVLISFDMVMREEVVLIAQTPGFLHHDVGSAIA